MLKIRLQGTASDIRWFKKILECDDRIHVSSISKAFSNKGTNKYFRIYAEIKRNQGG